MLCLPAVESAYHALVEASTVVGLKINTDKTKYLKKTKQQHKLPPTIDGDLFTWVNEFV